MTRLHARHIAMATRRLVGRLDGAVSSGHRLPSNRGARGAVVGPVAHIGRQDCRGRHVSAPRLAPCPHPCLFPCEGLVPSSAFCRTCRTLMLPLPSHVLSKQLPSWRPHLHFVFCAIAQRSHACVPGRQPTNLTLCDRPTHVCGPAREPPTSPSATRVRKVRHLVLG